MKKDIGKYSKYAKRYKKYEHGKCKIVLRFFGLVVFSDQGYIEK